MTEKISKTAIVTEDLAKSIRSGKYKPGEKLPSMRTLGKQYQVSTMVLYQACEKLLTTEAQTKTAQQRAPLYSLYL